jgi:hypothetical protein
LVSALAQQQQWAEAERISASIPDADEQAKALAALADNLATFGKHEQLLRLVHDWWLRVEQRVRAINLLPLAYAFIPRNPELGVAFCEAFAWVDTFLTG